MAYLIRHGMRFPDLEERVYRSRAYRWALIRIMSRLEGKPIGED